MTISVTVVSKGRCKASITYRWSVEAVGIGGGEVLTEPRMQAQHRGVRSLVFK